MNKIAKELEFKLTAHSHAERKQALKLSASEREAKIAMHKANIVKIYKSLSGGAK